MWVAKHSTPGLRMHELTREGKRDQLYTLGAKGADRDEILNQLYPEKS